MKKITLIKSLFGFSLIGGAFLTTALTTNCGNPHDETVVFGNAQGTNWPGYTSGSVTLQVNHAAGTCEIATGQTYVAHNLIIPDIIIDDDGFELNLTSISGSAFYNADGLTGTLTLGNRISTIGISAFEDCDQLTGLKLSNSITSIAREAFQNDFGITGSIVLPSNASFNTVNVDTFLGTGITSVTFPSNVTTIADSAFSECINLSKITSSFASQPNVGGSAFAGVYADGTLHNTNSAYSSSALLTFLQGQPSLPPTWVAV